MTAPDPIFFRRSPLAWALIAGLLAARSEGQGFVPVDDFEGLPLGPIAGLAGWSDSTGIGTVALDPDDPTNRVLAVTASGPSADLFKTLPFDIEEGAVGTLFVRVRPVAGNDHGLGLSDRADPSGTWSSFEAQTQWVDPDVLVRDGAVTTPVLTYTQDQWHNVWFVIDNQTDRYDVHVSSTGTPGPALADDFAFRNGPAANALESFFVRVIGTSTFWLDDVWLDPTATNLSDPRSNPVDPVLAQVAAANANAQRAHEAWTRSNDYYHGWLTLKAGLAQLLPQNLGNDVWAPENSAADNYGFMVLSAALTEPAQLALEMEPMLQSEILHTSRALAGGQPAVMPDDFDLSDHDFRNALPDVHRQTQGTSEYIKDGLLPVAEWLGTATPWFGRLTQLIDYMWIHEASLVSDHGVGLIDPDASLGARVVYEKHGENLQVLPRLFWQSQDPVYLDWALRLADHYLLDGPVYATWLHPTHGDQTTTILLQDHANEIVSGLVELYATLRVLEDQGDTAAAAKVAVYRQPLYDLLDFVLQHGRNPDGLFYTEIETATSATPGAVVDARLADTFGYVYYAFYTAWMVDHTSPDPALVAKVQGYRDEVRRALENLYPQYPGDSFFGGPQSDVFADSLEGTLNLFNREPDLVGVPAWLDSQIDRMWALQTPFGWINAGYADGNFARTSLMYALWKTRGVWSDDWRSDLRIGARPLGQDLVVFVEAQASNWTGTLRFDRARHSEVLGMPLDTVRINQFPEWFTVESSHTYRVWDWEARSSSKHSGAKLVAGLTVSAAAGDERVLFVEDLGPALPTVFCTAKLSSSGCAAAISTSDPASQPISAANDYFVVASNVQGLKNGLLFAGLNGPAALPFSGGTLCVQPPTKRGSVLHSDGSGPFACDGSFSALVNGGDVIPSGLDAGTGNSAWYQFWYRDPQNGVGPFGTALSNALQLDFQ